MEDVLSILVLVKRKAPAAGQFFVIFFTKRYFNAIGSNFARVQSHSKDPDFESQLKKLNCLILLLIAI